ncbi:MAG: carotenoid 1,2-hydratase [Acidobacteria bacterium]|nr:carotenoid 1,2-hydratase [Acidobacteriota bacterium]
MKSRIRSLIVAPIALFLIVIAGGFQYRASDEPWRKALPPYDFSFNRDHASHPDYKVEWWYYTGNLKTSDGRRFGYQLTFFRVGVDFKPSNPSRWAVRDLFMTHLAVSDIDGRKFRHSERINRAGIGSAGAQTDTYRVWNENWEARQDPAGRHVLHAVGHAVGQMVKKSVSNLNSMKESGRFFTAGKASARRETNPATLHIIIRLRGCRHGGL